MEKYGKNESLPSWPFLVPGQKVTLIKRKLLVDGVSEVDLGESLTGSIQKQVGIGNSLYLEDSNTSPVKRFYEEEGKYFFETSTSIYELVPEFENEEESTPEHIRILNQIEQNLDAQPESVQKLILENKDKFSRHEIIDGKIFIFSDISGEIVPCLVSEDGVVFKTRAFRFSGSDSQWKTLPGYRGDGSFMKGDESNPKHHYVQSAKLDKRIYETIQNSQIGEYWDFANYLPRESERFEDEFEYSEEYVELQNSNWKSIQEVSQNLMGNYNHYVLGAKSARNYLDQNSTFYSNVSGLSESMPEFKDLKDLIDRLNRVSSIDPSDKIYLDRLDITVDGKSSKLLLEKYQTAFGKVFELHMKGLFSEKSIIPNFDESNRIDSYQKKDSRGRDGITVEEYKVESPEGDELVWAMAYDTQGRVYIDNIYDPRVGISSYGAPTKITQMGILVYKPEDYADQTMGLPDGYKTVGNNGYVGISKLWENLEPIQKFKEELIRRGTLKQN